MRKFDGTEKYEPSLFDFNQFCLQELSSGKLSVLKIKEEYLTNSEIYGFAKTIAGHYTFKQVIGIPKGGLRLSLALSHFRVKEGEIDLLIVDDIYTTGTTLNNFINKLKPDANYQAVVLFARQKPKNKRINYIWELNQCFKLMGIQEKLEVTKK